MNNIEALKLLTMIQLEYPNDLRLSDDELENKVKMWAVLLKDYSYPEAEQGLFTYMSLQSANYAAHAPTAGQILDCINRNKNNVEQTMNGLEAWALVSLAIRNANYHAEEEFDKLPAIVQKAVGSPATLREWASMDSNTVHSVEQSNFMRTYDAVAKRVREDAKLPPEYRMPIEQQTTALLIEEQKTDNGERASAEEIDEMIRGLAEKMEVKR